MTDHAEAPRFPIRSALRWSALLALAGVTLAGYLGGWHEDLSLSGLIRHRGDLATLVVEHHVAALALFTGLYATVVALSFPGASLLTVAAGVLFGWIEGGLAALLGATAGATVVFLVARSSVGAVLAVRAGPFLRRLSDGFRRDAVSYLLFLRLTPVFPFWLVNIAPALFQVPLRVYVLTTAVGILPGTFAFAMVGSGFDSVIAAQEALDPGCAGRGTCRVSLMALLTPELLAALAVLGVVALLPVVVRLLRSRRKPAKPSGGGPGA
ncbi:TVP38/TMEM64 family protein [Microvirga tunisiensis]|uniref:TVP38/TMEM64 family membrane protein n=1 Tax=Pannonibacter tanglangensis TaxID=2750084 RepID=A0A7X5F613_9HYPH|nr:VTT domain-containing protein [Pannonibacter sp. XCT-53]NBN79164.1 TVP38/TMEM64 family protein [Pannonibacter sp. XCT-53]